MCLSSNGQTRSFYFDQSSIHTYFGGNSVSFCGSIPSLNVVAVAKQHPDETDVLNEFSVNFKTFFETTYGDILLVGSDEFGNECDVNINKIYTLLTNCLKTR